MEVSCPRSSCERGPRPTLTPTACKLKSFNDDQLRSATSLTTPPASDFWCGHYWRQGGRDLNPQPNHYHRSSEKADICHGTSKKPDGSWLPAQIRAEVRGWIHGVPNELDVNDPQGELSFNVEPDIGWEPNTPEVYAVNTFERVAQWMRPVGDHNRMGWFHVEYNMWGPNRVCGFHNEGLLQDFTGEDYDVLGKDLPKEYFNGGHGSYCASYLNGSSGTPKRPPEWCFTRPGITAYWPFDFDHPPHDSKSRDGALAEGDYVRIVGTLWEDMNHNNADPCMDDGHTAGRGWTEIHPVDFIARLPQPAVTSSGVAYISACIPSGGSNSQTFSTTVVPRQPRPGPNYRLHVQEIVDPEFTNFSSLSPGSQTERERIRVAGNVGNVSVTVSSVWLQRRGLFRGVYQAIWESCTPHCEGRCGGGNGCDGLCPSTCPAGQTCSGGAQCCPSGTRYCADQGRCLASCPCEPCECGGNSCRGSQACARVCRSRNIP